MKDCFGDEHQRRLINITVPPPRLLLLQAQSVQKHKKPGGMTSVVAISMSAKFKKAAPAYRFACSIRGSVGHR